MLDDDVRARARDARAAPRRAVRVDGLRDALDPAGLERVERLGLAVERGHPALTPVGASSAAA